MSDESIATGVTDDEAYAYLIEIVRRVSCDIAIEGREGVATEGAYVALAGFLAETVRMKYERESFDSMLDRRSVLRMLQLGRATARELYAKSAEAKLRARAARGGDA